MKKLIGLLTIILSITFLVSCGDKPPELEDRTIDATTIQIEKLYTGTISKIELDIHKDGTHEIEIGEGKTVVIQSKKINLSNYEDKEVTITGSMQKLIDNKSEVFVVEKIKLEGVSDSGDTTEYKSTTFGLQFNYPDVWNKSEDTKSITFESGGIDWVTVEVFSNIDSDLDEFVSSKEIEDGTAITVGAQKSLRYTSSDEIKIYTPNPSKKKVYRITFYNKGEDSDIHKKLFYSFLESFTTIVSKTKSGDECGGEDDIQCEDGYRCELESGDEDAKGICISVDDVDTSLDCPFVSTPSGCTNYEPKNLNKDGCPTSYECLDVPVAEDDLSASANNDDSTEPLSEAGSNNGATTGVTTGEKVVKTFEKYESKLLPTDSKVIQFEVVDEQNLVAVIYTVDDEKFRTLYTYSSSANEYSFEKEAHYEAGEERDWIIVDGDEIVINYDKTIIKPSGGTLTSSTVYADMRLYENTHRDFSVQYPKNWYYRSFGSIENTVWTVGFGSKSLDHVSDSTITVEILDEASSGKREIKDDRYLVEVSRDDDSHFLVDGPPEEKETIDKMASTIVNNQ